MMHAFADELQKIADYKASSVNNLLTYADDFGAGIAKMFAQPAKKAVQRRAAQFVPEQAKQVNQAMKTYNIHKPPVDQGPTNTLKRIVGEQSRMRAAIPPPQPISSATKGVKAKNPTLLTYQKQLQQGLMAA